MSKKENVTNFSCIETCPPSVIRREETASQEKFSRNLPYIPFGSDNLFPQCLAAIKRKAAIHNSIISWKTTYMIGSEVEETGDAKLDEWLLNVDGQGNGLQEIAQRHFEDDNTFGNYYLIFVTDKRRSFLNFKQWQSVNARWAKSKDGIIFHPDWFLYQNSKDLARTIPLYPVFEEVDGFEMSCIPMADYEPEFKFYGLPTYVAGLNTIAISYKTDTWNVSRLNNSFQPSGILEASVANAEDGESLLANAKKAYSGEGNNSRLLVVTRQPGQESPTTFTPFLQNGEGEFVNIHEISTSDQITAHKWFKSLSGISQSTGFEEGGKQMLTEFSIAIEKVVKPKQNSYLKKLRVVLKDFGFNPNAVDEIKFINNPPVSSYINEIDVNKVLKVGEAAELLGLKEEGRTEQERAQFIDNGKTSNSKPNAEPSNIS